MDMSALLGTITGVIGEVAKWATSFGEVIVDTPILLVGVVVGFAFTGVGLFRRLLNV